MEIKEVLAQAEEFCLIHDINKYPVNIVELSRKLGFSIYSSNLPSDNSGFIIVHPEAKKKYDSDKVIVVNANDSPLRQRFTVAHELAHYVLHSKGQELFAHRDVVNFGEVTDPKETEANTFASAVLMPANLIKQALEIFEGYTLVDFSTERRVEFIAKAFAVSKPAAAKRLSVLQSSGEEI